MSIDTTIDEPTEEAEEVSESLRDPLNVSVDELRERGAKAATVGLGIELSRRSIAEVAERWTAQLLASHKEATEASQSEIDQLKLDLVALGTAINELAVRRSAAAAQLQQLRKDSLTKIAAEHGLRFRLRAVQDAGDAELRHSIGMAEARAEVARADRTQNDGLMNRVADGLADQLGRRVRQLQDAWSHSHSMHERGFSRAVAGFLIWASFFSFAAIGSSLAHLFAATLLFDANAVPWLVALRRTLDPPGATSSLWTLLGRWAGLVGLLLLVLFVVTIAIYGLLRQLTPRGQGQQGRDRREQSLGDQIGGWLSMIQMNATALNTRLAVIRPAVLLQLVAAIPFLLAAGMVVFLVVLGTSPNPTDAQSSDFLYVGAAYAVLTASTGMLFWLNVLKPLVVGERPRGIVNFLYGGLFAVVLVAPWVVGLSAGNPVRATIATATALCCSTVALGHGLYLRGLFDREQFLERDVRRLEFEYARAAKMPSAEDFMGDLGTGSSPQPSRRRWRFARTVRRFVRSWFENPSAGPSSRKLPVGHILARGYVPEDLVEQFSVAQVNAMVAGGVLEAAQTEIAEIESEISKLRVQKKQIGDDFHAAATRRRLLNQQHARDMAWIESARQRADFAIAEAHSLALKLGNL